MLILICISLMTSVHMPVGLPYVLFGKMSIQIQCPFFNWIIYILSIELYEFAVIVNKARL